MKRSYMKRVGARGARRRVEWETAKAAHLAKHPTCEGRERGVDHECYGRIDVHHAIPRGSGGGKDYGVYVTLCRRAHDWVETHRAEAKELGLLISFWKANEDDQTA